MAVRDREDEKYLEFPGSSVLTGA